MKRKTLLLVFCLTFASVMHAQKHLPESKSLVGMWRQTLLIKDKDTGNLRKIMTGNYKVVNPDGTFYAFITWGTGNENPQKNITTLNMYGTYTLTSDNTFSEHIVKHSVDARMDNSVSELKYKFVPDNDNNIVYMMWKNNTTNQWIPEIWERITFPKNVRREGGL